MNKTQKIMVLVAMDQGNSKFTVLLLQIIIYKEVLR